MSDSKLIHGVPADFWNETKVPLLVGTCVFFIVLTVLAIVLRFYARIRSRVPLWWDDWFALIAVPFALISPIFDLVQIKNGFGRHQIVTIKTDPHKLENYGFNLYLIVLFYNPGLAFFKYSFLALFIRLFPLVTWLRYSCYVMATLITMWIIGNEFALAFRCDPVKANWIPTAGTCIKYETILMAQSIPTIFFDLAMLVLPVRIIWSLQMARPARVGVVAVFLLGGLVSIISMVRLAVLLNSSEEDLTWGYVETGLWSAAEPCIGLVCCCLPTYAPLIRALIKRTNLSWPTMDSRRWSTSNKYASKKVAPNLSDSSHLGGIRSTRSYWAGYEPSQDDSDVFQLTTSGDGRVVKGGPRDGDPEWNHSGIHVTQEVSVVR